MEHYRSPRFGTPLSDFLVIQGPCVIENGRHRYFLCSFLLISSRLAKTIRVALAQIGGGAKKVANLLSATETIRKAKELGAELVILPVT